jgi:hypothetical protein
MDLSLLSPSEINWVNEYHEQVWQKVSSRYLRPIYYWIHLTWRAGLLCIRWNTCYMCPLASCNLLMEWYVSCLTNRRDYLPSKQPHLLWYSYLAKVSIMIICRFLLSWVAILATGCGITQDLFRESSMSRHHKGNSNSKSLDIHLLTTRSNDGGRIAEPLVEAGLYLIKTTQFGGRATIPILLHLPLVNVYWLVTSTIQFISWPHFPQ